MLAELGARRVSLALRCALLLVAVLCQPAAAATPEWLQSLKNVVLPAYDTETETEAVLLFSDKVLTVQPDGKISSRVREAYKILRPAGERYGVVRVHYDAATRIGAMRAWSIPVAGKDYEVRERDAVDLADDVENGTLVQDSRVRTLRIPGVAVGSIVGYEYQQDERPYVLAEEWGFQELIPVREARYTLQLPPGWSHQSIWLNHAGIAPSQTADGHAHWVLREIAPIKLEPLMPPWRGIAGHMALQLTPPSGEGSFRDWRSMGQWYTRLTADRRVSTAAISAKVAGLTAGRPTMLEKMRALAKYSQDEVRYVAIELGIGGWQPHAAEQVRANSYGDCKDKVTLLSTMLAELGIESHYVIINTTRGAILKDTPPTMSFNHAIIAIQLPEDIAGSEMLAVQHHPELGRLLYFDPTDDVTPFGRLRGPLQANIGMLVGPAGGELVELPQLPLETNVIKRTAKLRLDADGKLHGRVSEEWLGDAAAWQRSYLRGASSEAEKTRPVEATLAASLASFKLLGATHHGLEVAAASFGYDYEFESTSYAKKVGELLVVRPRVLGSVAAGFLEIDDKPRQHAVEFETPLRLTDSFEIELPAGFKVDELPQARTLDRGYVFYSSKYEISGQILRYTRRFEIR